MTNPIAVLNDALRENFIGGQVVITKSLSVLGSEFVQRALIAVRTFDNFNADNDPYGEHDFGSLVVDDHKLFWQIVCYDPSMSWASPNPADPAVTCRVLTIMLAEDW